MNRISSRAALTAVAGSAVLGVLILGVSSDVALGASGGNGNGNNGNGNGNGGSAGTGSTPPPKALLVQQVTTAGASQSVAPGRPGWVTVSVTNPNNQAVVLTGVSGTVTSIGSGNRPGLALCDKTWITIAPSTARVNLPANGTTSVKLATSFNNLTTTNQDNCKGVTFSFSFTATGDQA